MRIGLQEHYGAVEQNHDQKVDVDYDLEVFYFIVTNMLSQSPAQQLVQLIDRVPDHGDHVKCEE